MNPIIKRKEILIIFAFALMSLLLSGCNKGIASEDFMINCGKSESPACFIDRMNECLPVSAKMMGADGVTEIDIIILGVEGETCHFQRKINGILDIDCHFPKGTMNTAVLGQTFGENNGLQNVVDGSCIKAQQ